MGPLAVVEADVLVHALVHGPAVPLAPIVVPALRPDGAVDPLDQAVPLRPAGRQHQQLDAQLHAGPLELAHELGAAVHLDAADGIGAPLADEPPQEVGGASGAGPGVHPAAEAAVAGSDGVEALERDAIPAERHVVDLDGRVPVPPHVPSARMAAAEVPLPAGSAALREVAAQDAAALQQPGHDALHGGQRQPRMLPVVQDMQLGRARPGVPLAQPADALRVLHRPLPARVRAGAAGLRRQPPQPPPCRHFCPACGDPIQHLDNVDWGGYISYPLIFLLMHPDRGHEDGACWGDFFNNLNWEVYQMTSEDEPYPKQGFPKDITLFRVCQLLVKLFRNHEEEKRWWADTRIFNYIILEKDYVYYGTSKDAEDLSNPYHEHVVPRKVLRTNVTD